MVGCPAIVGWATQAIGGPTRDGVSKEEHGTKVVLEVIRLKAPPKEQKEEEKHGHRTRMQV